MQPPIPSTRSLAILALAAVSILCIVSLGESFKALSSSSVLAGHVELSSRHGKRSWETELSPFSGPPGNTSGRIDDEAPTDDQSAQVGQSQPSITTDDKFGFPLPIPIATPLSIVACWFGHHCSSTAPAAGDPTEPGVPVPTDASGGGMFGSVLSILGGSPSAASGSSGGSIGPLGGLLSALSQAAPSPGITTPPTAGGGGLVGLNVLDGVASALEGVLGGSDGPSTGGSGLLGQLSANILDPLSSVVADPAAILADPTGAINNLQSQVSAVLKGMPSAMAAGMQLAGNVGGDIADALDATTDLLDSAPNVAGGVANQVGSLLNAGPALATGLPAAAMDAVDKVGDILSGVPGIGGAVDGLLAGMRNDLQLAASNAAPQMAAMAAVVGSQVAAVLPSGLQPLVAAAVASQQTAAPGSPSQAGQLGALLSSLSSSIATAAAGLTDSAVDSVANSALSGLSSLMGKISQLSLTAASTPPTVPASATLSPSVAQTTIYHVQTITALMTSTVIQTSAVTLCPSAFSSYLPSAYPSFGGPGGPGSDGIGSGGSGGSSGSSGTGSDGSNTGPCPGQGYTCSDCLDGWFCPPSQTPAAQVPCGYGWPCFHCEGGWFCIPEPQNGTPPAPAPAPLPMHAHSTSTPNTAIATAHPATNGYLYAGCYQDSTDRALRDAQLSTVAGGMTNGQCVDFCRTQNFAIAGVENGSQCFCGTLLLDSTTLDNSQCGASCAGDATNSTMCGGTWALSVWTIDGSIQQGRSPKRDLTSATALRWQGISGVTSKFDAATAIYGWPSLASPATMPSDLALPDTGALDLLAMNTSSLEAAMLAAIAAEASGLAFQPASANGILQSVSMILNMGMSSIAHDLSLALSTSNAMFSGVTNVQLNTGPGMPFSTFGTAVPGTLPMTAAMSTPTQYMAADPAGDAQDTPNGGLVEGVTTAANDDEGSYVFPTLPGVTTPGLTRGRRAPRRWAGWV